MLKFCVLIASVVITCRADAPVTPVSTPAPVLCGYIPDNIFKCLGNPKIVDMASHDCQATNTECDKMKCVFQKSGWLEKDNVKKSAVLSHFDQFAKDHPDWSKAVEEVKKTCLTGDLRPQGVFVNCPAYDVMMCSVGIFLGNAQPSQWSASGECSYPRQYAGACPVCPNDCFAAAVPYGSCNACLRLPRRSPTA